LDRVASDQRVIDLIGNEAFEELVNLIEGIWVSDIHNYTLTV
jgi:hypothetical protein